MAKTIDPVNKELHDYSSDAFSLHFQALFYIFIFRYKQLLELEGGKFICNICLIELKVRITRYNYQE